MNSRERNHFAYKNMEGFMEQITLKSDLKGFPNRVLGNQGNYKAGVILWPNRLRIWGRGVPVMA